MPAWNFVHVPRAGRFQYISNSIGFNIHVDAQKDNLAGLMLVKLFVCHAEMGAGDGTRILALAVHKRQHYDFSPKIREVYESPILVD
jgi:hypothetical protein